MVSSSERGAYTRQRLAPSVWRMNASMSSQCGAKPWCPAGVRYPLAPALLPQCSSRSESSRAMPSMRRCGRSSRTEHPALYLSHTAPSSATPVPLSVERFPST